MVERKCTQCGAELIQHNPGKLCFPCQEKINRELWEKNSDDPNYDINDMCSILGIGPEQVRRLGRENKIPGRIRGVKRHLYKKETVGQWISSFGEIPKTDSEIASMKESHEKSISFDKNLFKKLDGIMNERNINNLLLSLKLHRYYQASELIKVGKFCECIRYEGNRYIDIEIKKLQNDLFSVLEELIPLLKLEFEEDRTGKGEKDPLYRFVPSGSKYLDKSSMAKRVKEVEAELIRLIKEVKENYDDYRGCIRDRLYI